LSQDVELFNAVKGLADAGEYLDTIPGRLQPRPKTGWSKLIPGQGYVPVYTRGSQEHLLARAAGQIERLPPLTSAPPAAVTKAELLLGHKLPGLLRRLYLEIGNGGFGPGYGILGLDGGHTDDQGRNAVDLYATWPDLPPGVLPLCHWGEAIYSLVDCRDPGGGMWGFDPNPGGPPLFRDTEDFAAWLGRWVDGRLYQPVLIQDATGEWRGATNDEVARWAAEIDD
jgi:hypothetical protein